MTTYGSPEHIHELVVEYNYSLKEAKSFSKWMRQVDNALVEMSDGLGIDDLPDADFWSAWNGEQEPEEFAREMLEAEGFPFSFDFD